MTVTEDVFTKLLRPDEEILWLSKSGSISLIKPLIDYLRINIICVLLLSIVCVCFVLLSPFKGPETNQSAFEAFLYCLRILLPVILVVYALYWRMYRYEPTATYAVTNQRLLTYRRGKITTLDPNDIKKIDIVEGDKKASLTFTRDGGKFITWENITDVESILHLIRERSKELILVNRIPE